MKSQNRAQKKGTTEQIKSYAGLNGQVLIATDDSNRPYIATGEAGKAVPLALKAEADAAKSAADKAQSTADKKQDASNAVTLTGAQTIAGEKTFSAPVHGASAELSGGLTAGGVVKGQRLAGNNGVNSNLDFIAQNDGGWYLGGEHHAAGDWTEIMTANTKIPNASRADSAGSADSVSVWGVNGLQVGAYTYTTANLKGGAYKSVTLSVSRDAFGRLSGAWINTTNCNCDCATDCDCSTDCSTD